MTRSVQLVGKSTTDLSPVLSLVRYSRLKTVFRITAWIERFISNLRSNSKLHGEWSAEELFDTDIFFFFCPEISLLKAGKDLNIDSRIQELNPFLNEDHLLSVGGRLQHSDLTDREKHPWILLNNHRDVEMLAQYRHEKVMHAGVRETRNQREVVDFKGKASTDESNIQVCTLWKI